MAHGAPVMTSPPDSATLQLPLSGSIPSLPFRPSNPSLTTLFASTSTPPGSRPISPLRGRSPARATSDGKASAGRASTPSTSVLDPVDRDDPRSLIQRAFVPHIAVHVSADTDEIARTKGFPGGFRQLLRPFGEQVFGKVTVRDSGGASRAWDDFGVRFVGLSDGLGDPGMAQRQQTVALAEAVNASPVDRTTRRLPDPSALRTGGHLGQIEGLVSRHLAHAESLPDLYDIEPLKDHGLADLPSAAPSSPFYQLYLRRLLSGLPLSPHETFAHPVACIIAISSRTPSPIEALRQLYDSSRRGEKRLPPWVNGDYLRYYVLIHDEEHDDIGRSTGLFEAMKRHFGLHCHLLRLRSSHCASSDDDSIQVPRCEWVSAAEELSEIQRQEGGDDVEDPGPYLLESDVTAIKTFVREMVTQSVVPFMERCVSTWNDQVASRRRGLSGRFMSLSRKWSSFGSTSKSGTGSGSGGSGGSSGNYDAVQAYYLPEAPEAIMRKLADYAFMLRDWKLAQETYEMLRTDYNNDKAWKYHAGANEMALLGLLLSSASLKSRVEPLDQMLDLASYSYLTRCAAPYNALRCLALGVELLKLRGGPAADDAARWCSRTLELKILGPTGYALFTERVAACYGVRSRAGSRRWGARRRKSSMWHILAADAWLKQETYVQASKCLTAATRSYATLPREEGLSAFREMQTFRESLRQTLEVKMTSASFADGTTMTQHTLTAEGGQEGGDEQTDSGLTIRARPIENSVETSPTGSAPRETTLPPASRETSTEAA
ncbi:MAG: hypothetical protein M1838_002576 [Thelocarpon superellum]|nr:MAG: hypothetical protein M1838_002576 [Thelocarpon superellum]